MNSATNTQETADVQTEIGTTANAEVLQGALGACPNRVRERLMAKYPTLTRTEARQLEEQIQKFVQIYAEGRPFLHGHPPVYIRQNHHPQGIEPTREI
jgi:hypothetical protein